MGASRPLGGSPARRRPAHYGWCPDCNVVVTSRSARRGKRNGRACLLDAGSCPTSRWAGLQSRPPPATIAGSPRQRDRGRQKGAGCSVDALGVCVIPILRTGFPSYPRSTKKNRKGRATTCGSGDLELSEGVQPLGQKAATEDSDIQRRRYGSQSGGKNLR